jgi:hypothetical protein
MNNLGVFEIKQTLRLAQSIEIGNYQAEKQFNVPEAIFLVVCDPSMNELCVTFTGL